MDYSEAYARMREYVNEQRVAKGLDLVPEFIPQEQPVQKPRKRTGLKPNARSVTDTRRV